MPLDHLRLGIPVRIDAVERVEDEISVIARPIRGAARAARLAPTALRSSLLRMMISSLKSLAADL
jgi:hypothetical protein